VFFDTEGLYGGGICISSSSAVVDLADNTFSGCSGVYGGGVEYGGSSLSIFGNCFRTTSSSSRGTGISMSNGHGLVNVSQVTFHSCHAEEVEVYGTISKSGKFVCYYKLVNFSSCELDSAVGEGSIFEMRETESEWKMQYCTIFGCSGFSGVRSHSLNECEVQFCDFYANSFSASSGVISSVNGIILVDMCIFNGNSREFWVDVISEESGFRVLNCVFSSTLPIGSMYLSVSNNVYDRETATEHRRYLDTELCPAAPYVPTSSNLFTSSVYPRRRLGLICGGLAFLFIFGIPPSTL
jgi:hypothetical protein